MKDEHTIKQYTFENEAAQRSLQFLLQENAHLKMRLAGALDEMPRNDDTLEIMEQYQDWLVQNDQEINSIRHKAAEQAKLLLKYLHEDSSIKLIVWKQKQLRRELKAIDEAFTDLEVRFNDFLETVA